MERFLFSLFLFIAIFSNYLATTKQFKEQYTFV